MKRAQKSIIPPPKKYCPGTFANCTFRENLRLGSRNKVRGFFEEKSLRIKSPNPLRRACKIEKKKEKKKKGRDQAREVLEFGKEGIGQPGGGSNYSSGIRSQDYFSSAPRLSVSQIKKVPRRNTLLRLVAPSVFVFPLLSRHCAKPLCARFLYLSHAKLNFFPRGSYLVPAKSIIGSENPHKSMQTYNPHKLGGDLIQVLFK